MAGAWYGDKIVDFMSRTVDVIIGKLGSAAEGGIEKTQIAAWRRQTQILQDTLNRLIPRNPEVTTGTILFEYPVSV